MHTNGLIAECFIGMEMDDYQLIGIGQVFNKSRVLEIVAYQSQSRYRLPYIDTIIDRITIMSVFKSTPTKNPIRKELMFREISQRGG